MYDLMHFIPLMFVKDCFTLVVAQCRSLKNLMWLLVPMFFSFIHLDIFIEDMFLGFALLLYLEGSIKLLGMLERPLSDRL